MKKIVYALLIIALLTQSALAAEITFRGIPWYSNPDYTLKAMYPEYYNEVRATPERPIYEFGGDVLNGEYETVIAYNGGYVWNDIWPDESLSVAGYVPSSVEVKFLYDTTDGIVSTDYAKARFVDATYTLSPENRALVYDDLFSKLTSLYGEAHTIETVETYNMPYFERVTDSAVWYGDNDTAVMIMSSWCTYDGENEAQVEFFSSNTIWLYYGKTNTTSDLELINQHWEQEALKAEQESVAQNASNVDGL